MSQGVAIKGKTAGGQSTDVLVDADGKLIISNPGGGSSTASSVSITDVTGVNSLGVDANGRVGVNVNGTVPVSGTVTVSNPTENPETGLAKDATLTGVIKAEDSPSVSGDNGVPILAIRYASDTPTASSDGDYTLLKVDEEGRLKVSSKPASYADITGDITAIQATISTPVAGGTVAGDVSRASNVMAFCTGTFSGVNCTFEGSLESTGDTNWFGIQAIRSNANTIETTTGALSAQPAYSWEMSVNALKRVRVRATARTSGTQSWRFVQGTYATEPIPGAQASATQPVSGTVTITNPAGTTYNLVTTASTNAAIVKASAGMLYEITISNPTATAAYVKLYNKASAPTVGTDIPVLTISVPATSTTTMPVAIPFGQVGKRFATGIAISCTAAAAATDTANAVAGIQINATYI